MKKIKNTTKIKNAIKKILSPRFIGVTTMVVSSIIVFGVLLSATCNIVPLLGITGVLKSLLLISTFLGSSFVASHIGAKMGSFAGAIATKIHNKIHNKHISKNNTIDINAIKIKTPEKVAEKNTPAQNILLIRENSPKNNIELNI